MKFRIFAALLLAITVKAEPVDVSEQLERVRDEHDVPALAVAAMDEGKLVATGAAGFRNVRRTKEVTVDDLWLISSCTKSMTASVAAMLVEEGRIRWDSTLGEIFPEQLETMDEAWQQVKLEQLLVHRGGAPHDPPAELWKKALRREGTPTEQRETFVRGLLALPPAHAPGSRWVYSDSGYAIAGVMLERVSGKPFEELLRTRIFEPLGLKSAGFGAQATEGKLDQPWGHSGYDTPFKPVPPGPDADYPPAIAPAATVHLNITDFARYAQWHVDGARGTGRLLKEESFKKLHTPPDGQEYAMGWAVTKRKWAGGVALMHNGQNTMFYAVMWLGPAENTCFVAVCNADCQEAQDACDDAIRILINEF